MSLVKRGSVQYTVTAERSSDGRMWLLQCVEVPGALSEVRELSEADETMREAIAFVANVDEQSVDVMVRECSAP